MSTLGEPFLRQFYSGFLNDPTGIAVIARAESGHPVGVVVGTVDPEGFFSRLLRRRLVGFAGASVLATLRNPAAAPRLLRATSYRGAAHSECRGALLSSICVDPSIRHCGAGVALIAEWEHRAAILGADKAYLTTDAVDNDRVNGFYTQSGWSLAGTTQTPEGRILNSYCKALVTSPIQGARHVTSRGDDHRRNPS